MQDPKGPHKLKGKKYKAHRYRIPVTHSFDQVAGLLWFHPGRRVEGLKTARGARFWAEVDHHPDKEGESIIRLPWLCHIDKELWGWNMPPGQRMYVKGYSMALDKWAVRYYGTPDHNGDLKKLFSDEMPTPLRHMLFEPWEP
jgi:hypothetical protein